MKGFICSLLIVISSCGLADDGRIYKATGNPMGWSDRWGKFAVWFSFDEKFIFADGMPDMPLRLQFSSGQRFYSDSCLGHGAWFPILECSVVEVDDGEVVITTFGGHHVRLFVDSEGGSYRSHNLKWSGELNASEFHVQGPEGWQFLYERGRLRSVETPRGEKLRWVYTGDRVDAIESDRRGRILRAEYFDSGLLRGVTYEGGDELAFEYGQFPAVEEMFGRKTIAGLLPVLSGVRAKSGYACEINVLSGDISDGEYSCAFKDSSMGDEVLQVRWRASDGRILEANGWAYNIISDPMGKNPYPKLQRESSEGEFESYYFDVSKMEETRQKGDEIVKRIFMGAKGASSMRVRSITRSDGRGDIATLVYHYDSEGRVVRELRDDNEVYKITRSSGEHGRRESVYRNGEAFVERVDFGGDVIEETYRNGLRAWRGGDKNLKIVLPDGRQLEYGASGIFADLDND